MRTILLLARFVQCSFQVLPVSVNEMEAAGPGLTATRFFESISDQEIRHFIDSDILAVLDKIFGGKLVGAALRRVARTLVDLDTLLGEPRERGIIIGLLSGDKRVELEDRIGRRTDRTDESEWNAEEIRQLRGFFGLEERFYGPAVAPVESIAPAYGLFDHQRVAVRRLQPMLQNDERRAVLHLPTGVGKTRTAMHVVAETLRMHDPSVVVWLASGRELLEQAVLAFKEAWRHLGNRELQVGSMWGGKLLSLKGFTDGFLAVGLAKAWAMLSKGDPGWAARLARYARLVVFDEAHQSIAPTHQRITNELTSDLRCALLGLTATPGRTWADIDKDEELATFFARNKVTLEVPSDNPIEYLIDQGYLARPRFETLLAEPGLQLSASDLARIAGSLDIPEQIVASLSMSVQYIAAVVEAVQQLLLRGHQRILLFAATVEHALVLSAILLARGVTCEAVTSSTPDRVRERAIRNFTRAPTSPMVLANFGVLTTGFDAPKASAVVIARPTQSLVLYSQMVGRAIRGIQAGGTESCEVLTVVDPGLPGFRSVAEAFLNWEDVWS